MLSGTGLFAAHASELEAIALRQHTGGLLAHRLQRLARAVALLRHSAHLNGREEIEARQIGRAHDGCQLHETRDGSHAAILRAHVHII